MTTTITRGVDSVSPALVLGYKSARTAKNLIHPIIGRPDPDVTLAAAGLRTGTLELFCLDLAQALAVEALHAGEGVCQLEDTDLPALNMFYVASGEIGLELDEETRLRWVVSVEYQEVLA